MLGRQLGGAQPFTGSADLPSCDEDQVVRESLRDLADGPRGSSRLSGGESGSGVFQCRERTFGATAGAPGVLDLEQAQVHRSGDIGGQD